MRSCLAALGALMIVGCQTIGPAGAAPRPVSPISTVTTMEPVINAALAAARRDGPGRVIVIFDLDSTLLFDPLGGPNIGAMKDSEPERFRPVERALMYLKSLAPTETDLAEDLAELERAGIITYALTARGEDMRDMTERELARNNLRFPLAPECGPPLCITRGTIQSDQVYAVAQLVLGEAELERLGFTHGRPIGVSGGVMNAAGLHKGVMLRTLLASLGRQFDTVIFVDDAKKNVDDVHKAAQTMAQEVLVYHYRMDRPEPPLPQELRNQRWEAAVEAICLALSPAWCEAGT